MQLHYILKTEIYHNISIYLFYFIFLERPRSPWEVHAESLGLRGAQVENLWYRERECARIYWDEYGTV